MDGKTSVGIPAAVAVEAVWRGRRCMSWRSESVPCEGESAGPSIRPFRLNARYQKQKQKQMFEENVFMSYVGEASIPSDMQRE